MCTDIDILSDILSVHWADKQIKKKTFSLNQTKLSSLNYFYVLTQMEWLKCTMNYAFKQL